MRYLLIATLLVSGCALVPVQDTTLVKPDGARVTCKEVGAGVVSYWIGKSRYDDCVRHAKEAGYSD